MADPADAILASGADRDAAADVLAEADELAAAFIWSAALVIAFTPVAVIRYRRAWASPCA